MLNDCNLLHLDFLETMVGFWLKQPDSNTLPVLRGYYWSVSSGMPFNTDTSVVCAELTLELALDYWHPTKPTFTTDPEADGLPQEVCWFCLTW